METRSKRKRHAHDCDDSVVYKRSKYTDEPSTSSTPATLDEVEVDMSRKNLNKNAISAFEEYGVQHRQPPSVKVVDQSGPPHKPIFWAEASLGGKLVCRESGGSKHEARIKAAERALQQLSVQHYAKEDQHDEDNFINPIPYKDPVTALMEYAQSVKVPVELVHISQDGAPHMPIFTFEAHVGETKYSQVTGSSIKEAKKKAACVALNALKESGRLQKVFPDVSLHKTTQPVPGPSKSSLALPGKNPVSILNEFAQKKCIKLHFLSKQSGPSHKPVCLGDEEFPVVQATNKKEGDAKAAERVLAILAKRGLYEPPLPVPNTSRSPSNCPAHSMISPGDTTIVSEADRIAIVALKKVDELFLATPESLVGRKVVAAIIMKNESTRDFKVISVGTGNRCIRGSLLCDQGTKLHDSHAEILARRGFKRFLYSLLTQETNEYLMPRRRGQTLRFKGHISFHLYISTAPCGDGAIFTHSINSGERNITSIPGSSHQPCFTNPWTQGLLRAKQENGEGTIPLETEVEGQTLDGVQQGDRLRIMSCSDKICLWNVLGMQGALLSNIYDPVYLASVTLSTLYEPTHLSRALCCRVDHQATPLTTDLPRPYHVNHPEVRVALSPDSSRAVERSRPHSVNWSHGDNKLEITDGTTGLKIRNMSHNEAPSRLCKRQLFQLYKTVTYVPDHQTYRQAKLTATNYCNAKIALKKRMEEQGFGRWIPMPIEFLQNEFLPHLNTWLVGVKPLKAFRATETGFMGYSCPLRPIKE